MAGAGYNLFVAGQKLTAAQVNTYLMQQSVMQFADASARNTALSAVLDEMLLSSQADTNTLTIYSGSTWSTIGPVHGAWTTYAPSWTANGGSAPSIGNGTLDGAYQRLGRSVRFRLRMVAGTTTTFGSGSSPWRFTIPVAAGAGTPEQVVSDMSYLDLSAATYTGVFGGIIDTSSTFVEVRSLHASTIAWATGDKVLICGEYECGSDG